MHLGTLTLDTLRSLNEGLRNGVANISIDDTATVGSTTYKVALDGSHLQFVVQGAGNSITEAQVSTLAGTPDEVRTLSDGSNKGVRLRWSQPEGGTAYAWCWDIYPLSRYEG